MEHSLIRILPVGLTEPLPDGWDLSEPGYLIEVVPALDDASTLAQMVAEIEPDVLLIDADSPAFDAFATTRQALEVQPGLAVIMVSRDVAPERLHQAMLSGAEEYLGKPLGGADTNAAIIAVASHRTLRRVQLTPVADTHTASSGGAEATPAMNGLIVGIVAGKGGLGKTTVAANLALLAARAPARSAALLGLETGDGAILLNLQPKLGMIDLATGSTEDQKSYTGDWIKQFSVRHKSGLHYWTWQGTATQSGAPIPEHFFEVFFAALRASFAVTVVDFPMLSAEEAAEVLPLLDSVVVVSSTSDLLALRSTKAFLDIMEGADLSNTHVVINRADASDMITREDFENTLGRKVSGVIANQPALTAEAINMGAPVVLMQPQSDIAADLRDVARKVLSLPAAPPPVQKKKLFGFLGGRKVAMP
ncbi:MAG TPA: hypothetical protein VM821_07955 [Abditibacteriaceae bacterium]|jgi:Flp pilus assembly CpaE family ATPase|nr:hypothetical protein [Abditibacteriaceae bacterium]